ncbi:MAG: hypothetical protein ACYC8T_06630 [Myxococcaceae bacterium]
MKKLLLLAALASVAVACAPAIDQVDPPAVVIARFDPSLTPPLVPTPNDLATDPATGLLAVPVPATATDADLEFAAYLNTLDGFPAGATATVTFDGAIDAATVSAASVMVLDLDDGAKPVDGLTRAYLDAPHAAAAGTISVKPPATGWKAGARYAVAVVGGDSGLKGAAGTQVVGSITWALLRSEHSLVTDCPDLASPTCRAATELIPSTETDPAKKIADQAAKAVRLEGLRLKYKPVIEAAVAAGAKRSDIALAWTFKISSKVTMGFNPAANPKVLPIPTDLAMNPATGLVNAPIDPTAPAAQQEFTRDYLNTLDGFPVTAAGAAVVLNGDLDPATVGPSTVLVLDLAPSDAGAPVIPTINYDDLKHQLNIQPPAGGWPKGGRYAVAVVSAESGVNSVKALGDKTVVASDAFALVRGEASLVTCEVLTDPTCAPAISMAPLDLASALGLEGIRRSYAPIFDALAASGVRRPNVALLWTFRVVSRGEATFDPSTKVIPFPNDLLLDPATGKVNLPVPAGASPMMQALIGGLNTLDGFSLTAPLVSENSDSRGALDRGAIDPATLADGGTGFVKLTPGGTTPEVKVCLDCASSLLPDGGAPSSPQQLQFVPTAPLDEKSKYAAFITTGVKDEDGKPIIASPSFALLRSSAPLVEGGKSVVSGVSDAQAVQLEPVRQAMKPLIDALVASGVERKKLALAWAFTTQGVHTPLKGLNLAPTVMPVAALPTVPDYVADISSQLAALPTPHGNIGKLYAGRMVVPFLLTSSTGTLNPGSPQMKRIPFLLTLPTAAAPAGGYPVVVFGHGLQGNRSHMLAIADAFANAGVATIATDVVWHGERTTCVGWKTAPGQTTDDAACADPLTQACDAASGRCVARNPSTRAVCNPASPATGDLFCMATAKGACISDGAGGNVCEGGDFLRNSSGAPAISGWNILNLTNLFATRDNFRQQVVDLSQLSRLLSDVTTAGNLNAQLASAGASAGLNPAKIHYTGQSLGGILGTLYNSVSSTTHNVALNVPGGDLAGILLDSPAFAPQKAAFLGTLATQGLTPGTPGFDNFIGIARWILDASDPQNVGYQLTHGTSLAADRKVLIQYIKYDFVVPNNSTAKLIAGANRTGDAGQCSVREANPTFAELPAAGRHGFLLNFANPAATAGAQQQVVTFVTTGVAP